MDKRSNVFVWIGTLAASAALWGCSGASKGDTAWLDVAKATAHAGPGAEGRRLPADARVLRFLFVPANADDASTRASNAVRDHLLEAGYTLTEDAHVSHDGRIEVAIQRMPAAEDWDDVYLQVALKLYRGADVVEWLVEPRHDPSSVAGLSSLVDRLTCSPAIEGLAVAHSRDVVAHQSRVLDAPSEANTTDQRTLDDAAWSTAAVRQCRNSRVEGACSRVEQYLTTFPDGVHVADARAVLSLARRRGPAR
jgi:hypothetical protein